MKQLGTVNTRWLPRLARLALLAAGPALFGQAPSPPPSAPAPTLPAPAPVPATPPAIAVSPAQIAQWIAQLGDDHFTVREAAQARLRQAGAAAYDLLQQAARDAADAEVRDRAGRLVADLDQLFGAQRLAARRAAVLAAAAAARKQTLWHQPDLGAQTVPVAGQGVLLMFAGKDIRLTCVEQTTGAVRWVSPLGHAQKPPALDAQRVYLVDASDVVALDLATGQEQWRTRPATRVGVKPDYQQLAIGGGKVYATASGKMLMALDAATGAKRWQTESPLDLPRPPAVGGEVVAVAGFGVVNGAGQPGVLGLDGSTGKVKWEAAETTYGRGGPVRDGVWYRAGTREVAALDLADGKNRWRFATSEVLGQPGANPNDLMMQTVCAEAGADDRQVYVSTRAGLIALDRATGKHTWYHEVQDLRPEWPGGADAASGPDAAGARAAVPRTLGDPLRYMPCSSAQPAVPAADVVLLPSWLGVHALDRATGQERWRIETGGFAYVAAAGGGAAGNGDVIFIAIPPRPLGSPGPGAGQERGIFAIRLGTSKADARP